MLKNKKNSNKREEKVVYFRRDPENGSDKYAKFFFIKVGKENVIERIINRCYIIGENNVVMVAKF